MFGVIETETKMVAAKPYELKMEKRQHYLYARVKSDSPRPTIARDYLKDITRKFRETDCRRLVIENDLPQSFWVWDMFAVATQFPNIGIECTKVAIIDKFAPIENEVFSVVTGKESGLDVHVFTDLASAEHWLLDN